MFGNVADGGGVFVGKLRSGSSPPRSLLPLTEEEVWRNMRRTPWTVLPETYLSKIGIEKWVLRATQMQIVSISRTVAFLVALMAPWLFCAICMRMGMWRE